MVALKERRAKIFKNGRSRAVRIPAEFEFDAQEVILRQAENGEITISPMSPKEKNQAFREMLERFAAEGPLGPEGEFPDIDDSDMLPLDESHLGDFPEDEER
ncbi:AbrB/MazE/SpoVT family DNA-binding domain-containing protein [Fulvimarina sp. MAC8]|uniref:antitoxin n=1 Tax=Fulvimarina sp. MAC8 TaxID=3162874 RepID=UPI0032EE2D0D